MESILSQEGLTCCDIDEWKLNSINDAYYDVSKIELIKFIRWLD